MSDQLLSPQPFPAESSAQYLNIAAYKFVALDGLSQRRADLLSLCRSLNLKGTILLSSEGINMFLAGTPDNIRSFLKYLTSQAEFSGLEVKESFSDHQPFSRMLVRIKKEIISMGVPEIQPTIRTSPKISPKDLKTWLDQGTEVTLLDTRNDYEYQIGSFENSILLPIDHFRQFPDAVDQLPADLRDKPIVMFCTGGIRCEKAGPLMEAKGFKQVYQLDGGILKYFEECGSAHYRGDCFVFDKRVALNPQLQETGLAQCFNCQAILSLEDQTNPLYQPPKACPRCHPLALSMEDRLRIRGQRLRELTTPLPGSVPYVNQRPMSVTAKFDQQPLIEFLLSLHVELTREYWLQSCAEGRVRYRNRPLQAEEPVRAGWRLYHLVPDTVEPDVSNQIEFLYEDQNLIAINKPAPLPMHPCGRFNKNSLQNFLRLSYPHETIRILHRLDAETTGLLVLGRDRVTAARLHQQFASGQVQKTYLARVHGNPQADQFECQANISSRADGPGGIRRAYDAAEASASSIDPAGDVAGESIRTAAIKNNHAAKPSITRFEVIRRLADGTTLIKCFPLTGRTNQIRVHLAHLGLPIVGDTGYGLSQSAGSSTSDLVSIRPSALPRQHNHAQAGSTTSDSVSIRPAPVRAGDDATDESLATSSDSVSIKALAFSNTLNLHAAELQFEYPPKNKMRLVAPAPDWAQVK